MIEMYELWARKRTKDNIGYDYEHICNFENENQKYFMIDCLDKNFYQEAMVILNQQCVLYIEFEVQKTKSLKKEF